MAQYDVTLRDYWRIVRKRKLYIIFATVMLGLTSFATAHFSKPDPRYRAEAKVQYERSTSAEDAYAFALGGGDDLETQQSVIKSYELVERIARRTGRLADDADDETRIQAILGLRGYIVTGIEGLTNIISISITHGNAYDAQELANITANEYREYNYQIRNAKIIRSRAIISKRRDDLLKLLTAAQESLKTFQEEEQIISIDAATSSVLSRLGTGREYYDHLQGLEVSIKQLLSSGDPDEGQLQSFPPEEGGGRFAQLQSELESLNEDINRLMVTFTERHPDVKKVNNRKKIVIQHMQAALLLQQGLLVKRLENQKETVAELDTRFKQLPTLGLELEELYRNVALYSTLLQSIENEYQLSQIAEAEEVFEVTILQKALFPRAPINPSTPTTIAGVGALLGMIIGVVAAFVAETLDTSIGTIEDVEEYLEVPVVGIIPQMDIESMREALEARTGGPVDTEFVERHLRLSTHFEPQSTMAESYRALRTNIQFANLEKGAKVICITSSSHQEGKSTTSANLAVTLAQAGNRVLLVDGDLRRPTVARNFGLDREPGITDVILGNYTWREVVRTVTDIMVGGLGLDDIMMTAGMDNLNIITSGVLPPNPAEITDSRRMTEFLQEVKEAYDVVIVDAPPVLQAKDATVLGTKVDGVLIVYKIGNVSRSALRRAKLQLDTVGVTTLGVVINGLRADVSEDFKDLRYYSYYTYGQSQDEETGNAVQLFYNRTKRQVDTAWQNVKTQAEPIVAQIKEKLPIERFFPSQDEEQGYEEEENDLPTKILSISFWVFLVLFLVAGLAWQLGYINPGRPQIELAPLRQAEQPTSKVEETAPETTPTETPAMPDQTAPETPVETPTKETTPAPDEASRLIPQEPSISKNTTNEPQKHANQGQHPLTKQPAGVSTVAFTQISPSGTFAIHVSSHKVESSANRDTQRYKKWGYPVQVIRMHVPNRGIFHRVYVGRYTQRQLAQEAMATLKTKAQISYAAVIKLPIAPEPQPLAGQMPSSLTVQLEAAHSN